jgi:hypothetical protein
VALLVEVAHSVSPAVHGAAGFKEQAPFEQMKPAPSSTAQSVPMTHVEPSFEHVSGTVAVAHRAVPGLHIVAPASQAQAPPAHVWPIWQGIASHCEPSGEHTSAVVDVAHCWAFGAHVGAPASVTHTPLAQLWPLAHSTVSQPEPSDGQTWARELLTHRPVFGAQAGPLSTPEQTPWMQV